MATAAAHWRLVLASALALAGVVFLWGGYVEDWTWTGLSGDVALWDWLEALALPLTVGLLPLLLLRRQRLRREHRMALLVAVAAFVCLVLAGYLVPWTWTGFTGNTLWDWLELALLPVVLATATFWPAPEELRGRDWALVAAAGAVFLAVVAAGYLVPWDWTGFTDNKVWDWLKLLLLPVLVPTVLLPALQRFLDDRTTGAAVEPEAPPHPSARSAEAGRREQETSSDGGPVLH